MKKIYLEAYVIKVRKKYTKKASPLPLGNFDGTSSLYEVFKEYLADLKKHKIYTISSRERSVRLKVLKEEQSFLYGTLQVGDYGYASEIIDIQTGNVSYNKKKTDTDPAPFHFHFCLPSKSKEGILLIQKIGILGIRTDLSHILEDKFRAAFPDYKLEVNPAVPSDVVNQIIKKGVIEEIRFIKHNIPADKADYFSGKKKETEGSIILSVQPDKPGFFNDKLSGIVGIVRGTKKPTEVFDIPNFDYDTVKAQINVGGRPRTVDLANWARLKSSFDITSSVRRSSDGFPTEDSIEGASRSLILELAGDAGIVI